LDSPVSLPFRDAGGTSGPLRVAARNEFIRSDQPYAIIVGDDSMAPEIMPGDIAYIQPCFIYHPFMEQNLGRDLFGVRLDAGDAVGTSLKRCCVQSNLLIFYSNNVKYSPVILDMNKILFVPLIGKVVSIWRSYLDSDMLERIREADDD
jgi:SOS-response transcriptional repressor LexA